MIKNYIFDLYGTLIDIQTNESKPYMWDKLAILTAMNGANYTASELRRAYSHKLRTQIHERYAESRGTSHFITLRREFVEPDIKLTIREIFADKGVDASDAVIASWAQLFRAISIHHIALYPEVHEMLSMLKEKGKKVYLLSNAQRLFTDPEMTMFDLPKYFDGILYSSDVGCKKPHKWFYQALLDKYQLKPEESVMIGNDFTADAWGASDMEIGCMYVHTNQSPDFNGPLPEECTILSKIGDVMKTIK